MKFVLFKHKHYEQHSKSNVMGGVVHKKLKFFSPVEIYLMFSIKTFLSLFPFKILKHYKFKEIKKYLIPTLLFWH